MKHPQHIAAILKESFGPLEPGLNKMLFGTFIERTKKSLFIGRRHELEENEEFGQLLPYVVLKQGDKIFVYERTKMVGEKRLAGMSSVGIGGHIDMTDILFEANSIIDIMATLAYSISREMAEEIVFELPDGVQATIRNLRDSGLTLVPQFIGVINDTSNEVGRVHYGALFTLEVPEQFKPVCAEDELTTRGMLSVDALKTEVMESWSNIVIAHLSAA